MGFTKYIKNRDSILSLVVLLIASFTYLSTIEPTAGFWDCGEFIASSYKLEVGHPPGNPVFQLVARFFTLFGDKTDAAMLVNAMSAICSAFTILFLYLTIVLLGRGVSLNGVVVSGAALVGSLAYCFSDTFWFSAVEGEVYAMSSLFTAVVFWAMLKWESEADKPYANRWIILIAFLMGVSIGVHLLNLLTIPALVFIYYCKKYKITFRGSLVAFSLSGIILAVILYGMIPYIPKGAAYVDLFFVNVLGFPVNSGTTLFVTAVLLGGFAGIYYSYKRGRVLLNMVLLSGVMIVIGYSVFAVVVIRSCANTPTNEYQPDNPFTLVRYLEREQYGSKPLVYGETFASLVTDVQIPKYYNYHQGRYIQLDGPANYQYHPDSKMLFPRMWSAGEGHVAVYNFYTQGRGKRLPGGEHKIPSFKDNLWFFWDYQIDFMYLRYFMWNFAGRQNDLQATMPDDPIKGNWESGFSFIDRARLGDGENLPDYIAKNRAKNHYYFLPLILGIFGFLWQFKKDRKRWFVIILLFFLTGLAIVVYLNQPPLQVRERDYAYAGSFYAFCIWIGFAVIWLAEHLEKISGIKGVKYGVIGWFSICLLLLVPLLMALENWDDHDRSGRYTTREMACNILTPLDSNAVLVTHTDNDTFPLWYLQEVEGIRTDVRIMNTSLLGTDWYIDQMRRRIYESDPVLLSINRESYFYGTNDVVIIHERIKTPVLAKEVMDVFKNPRLTMQSPFIKDKGKMLHYIVARKIVIPVNREAVIRNKIVPECDYDKIVDSVVLTIPADKGFLTKDELVLLDMLSCYDWERPLYFLGAGAVNIGIKEWLQFEGFAHRFVPIKSNTGVYEMNAEQANLDVAHQAIMDMHNWKTLGDSTIHIDYQNLITFSAITSPRQMMVTAAQAFYDKWKNEMPTDDGWREKAVALLEKAFADIPAYHIPLSTLALDGRNDLTTCRAVNLYFELGELEKADVLADQYYQALLKHIYIEGLEEQTIKYIYTLSQILGSHGRKAAGEKYLEQIEHIVAR